MVIPINFSSRAAGYYWGLKTKCGPIVGRFLAAQAPPKPANFYTRASLGGLVNNVLAGFSQARLVTIPEKTPSLTLNPFLMKTFGKIFVAALMLGATATASAQTTTGSMPGSSGSGTGTMQNGTGTGNNSTGTGTMQNGTGTGTMQNGTSTGTMQNGTGTGREMPRGGTMSDRTNTQTTTTPDGSNIGNNRDRMSTGTGTPVRTGSMNSGRRMKSNAKRSKMKTKSEM